MDVLKQALVWAGIGLAIAPIWGAFIWELWEAGIRPRLIPAAEVDALAAAMLARYGDKAGKMAFIEEDRAWRYSDGFEQGRWRRVRKRTSRCRDYM
ncbi:MAG: hypothetical protein ABSC37_05760 [Xanthobacteraceae bacterium]